MNAQISLMMGHGFSECMPSSGTDGSYCSSIFNHLWTSKLVSMTLFWCVFSQAVNNSSYFHISSPAFVAIFLNECYGCLYENGPRRFICLKVWSPVGRTLWEWNRSVARMKEFCYWGRLCHFKRLIQFLPPHSA